MKEMTAAEFNRAKIYVAYCTVRSSSVVAVCMEKGKKLFLNSPNEIRIQHIQLKLIKTYCPISRKMPPKC